MPLDVGLGVLIWGSGDLATYANRIESFTVFPLPGFLEKYLGIGPSDFVEEHRKNQKTQ